MDEDLHGDAAGNRGLTKVYAEIYKPGNLVPVAQAICAKHNRIQAGKDRSTFDELISTLCSSNPKNDKDLIKSVRNSDYPFPKLFKKENGVATFVEDVEKTVCM